MNTLVDVNSGQLNERLMTTIKQLKYITDEIDDQAISGDIKKFLRAVAEPFTFAMIGEVNSGKSSFINHLLEAQICPTAPVSNTTKVHEIRYGVEDVKFDVSADHEKIFLNSEVLQNICILDTPGIGLLSHEQNRIIDGILPGIDSVFCMLSAVNPRADETWKKIQQISRVWKKPVIFVLNKIDLVEEQELKNISGWIEYQASEYGIVKPNVFTVSFEQDLNSIRLVLNEIRAFIKNELTNESVVLHKNLSAITSTNALYMKIATSFSNRIKQYEVDVENMHQINRLLDNFRDQHSTSVDYLIKELSVCVEKEIDDYKDEIIKRLDPETVTEKYKNKGDFEIMLKVHNDFYKEKMVKAIERRTQQSMKSYMWEVEKTVEQATRLLESRPNYLQLEDAIYGTIAKTQNNVVRSTTTTLTELSVSNRTLCEASDELFIEIWQARKEYNRNMLIAKGTGTIVGLGGGAWLGTVLASAVAGMMSVSAAAVVAVLLPVALAGVLGIVGYEVLKFSAKNSLEANMNTQVNLALSTFNTEIIKIKDTMKLQIGALVSEAFDVELKLIERQFLDFRINTQIEEDKISQIKNQLNEVEQGICLLMGSVSNG